MTGPALRLTMLGACLALASGISFAEPPDAWQQRLLAYRPYDGAGRYTMSADDGIRSIQGLRELSLRWGAKPYDQLKTGDGTWLSERVIFHDVDTGALMMRLTNDPWADALSYFHGAWSADGKYFVWRRRPGMWETSTPDHGPMAMRADGTELRNVFRDYPMVRNEVCSPSRPDVCYATPSDAKVVEFNIATGRKTRELRDVKGCWHLKVSLDGKYLMDRSDVSAGGKGFWVLGTDAEEFHEVRTGEGVHDSYQFHPAQPARIMFWYDALYRTQGFQQCEIDGGRLTRVPVQFDWNHGDVGLDRGAHCEGYITRIDGNTWLSPERLFAKPGVEYYDDPHDYNGYLAWMPKDQLWVYSTRILRPPHVSEIHSFYADPASDGVVNRFRVSYTALKRGGALDNPNASPDGTKMLFNSNMLGSVNVYSVVAKLPEPPTGVKAEPVPDGVRLTWQPPKHHLEIAGYHVYRSAESGRNFVPVTAKPVTDASFTVDGEAIPTGIYAVTAVEHSGLESPLSVEVTLKALAKHCVTVEAEDGARSVEMWSAFHGTASNLHYVWMRKKEGTGKVTLNVTLPLSPGPWALWGRVKGEKAVQFTATVAGVPARLDWGPTAEWAWVRFAGFLPLKPGANEVLLTSDLYGSAVDALVASDDPAFQPAAWPKVKWPALAAPSDLRAEATSLGSVRLTWKPDASATFHHYNVYCGAGPEVATRQENLIASPDGPTAVDWGLKPGQTLHYVVTAVDRAMNESAPSQAAKVTLPTIERFNFEKEFVEPVTSVTFDAPKKDTYVVWLQLERHDGGGNYIDLSIDSAPKHTWTASLDGLSDAPWMSYGPWGQWTLDPGRHTLTVANKTRHKVTKVFVTNDLSQRPEGHVNILSGW